MGEASPFSCLDARVSHAHQGLLLVPHGAHAGRWRLGRLGRGSPVPAPAGEAGCMQPSTPAPGWVGSVPPRSQPRPKEQEDGFWLILAAGVTQPPDSPPSPLPLHLNRDYFILSEWLKR